MTLKISTTPTFNKTAKKLFDRDKKAMDTAVKAIADNPTIGEEKKGDLSGIFVFKFKMNKQQILLSYTLLPNKEHPDTLVLLSFGSHENFYDDLKHQLG